VADSGARATARSGTIRRSISLPGAGQALIEFVVVLAVLAAVVVVVGWPLRARRVQAAEDPQPERAELEAAREAKYREIRDADLDHRTGKLSDADFEALDRQLRAEAMQILRALDRYHRPST
jgi:flagellar biosynthesis/type III secretory pathway M-ring protein FliF/YscJ